MAINIVMALATVIADLSNALKLILVIIHLHDVWGKQKSTAVPWAFATYIV